MDFFPPWPVLELFLSLIQKIHDTELQQGDLYKCLFIFRMRAFIMMQFI